MSRLLVTLEGMIMKRLRLAVCLDVPQRELMLVVRWGGSASLTHTREWVIRVGRFSTPPQSGATTNLALPVHSVPEGDA